jgi:hypothetical protein
MVFHEMGRLNAPRSVDGQERGEDHILSKEEKMRRKAATRGAKNVKKV